MLASRWRVRRIRAHGRVLLRLRRRVLHNHQRLRWRRVSTQAARVSQRAHGSSSCNLSRRACTYALTPQHVSTTTHWAEMGLAEATWALSATRTRALETTVSGERMSPHPLCPSGLSPSSSSAATSLAASTRLAVRLANAAPTTPHVAKSARTTPRPTLTTSSARPASLMSSAPVRAMSLPATTLADTASRCSMQLGDAPMRHELAEPTRPPPASQAR